MMADTNDTTARLAVPDGAAATPDEDWHEDEPIDYRLIIASSFKTHVLGDTERTVGFCVNSPGAAGYCDKTCIWIADQITDPERVIEICIHECLHGIFPNMSEDQVLKAGLQVAAFIASVFRVKGDRPLPKLMPLLTSENVEKLFGPSARLADEISGKSEPTTTAAMAAEGTGHGER